MFCHYYFCCIYSVTRKYLPKIPREKKHLERACSCKISIPIFTGPGGPDELWICIKALGWLSKTSTSPEPFEICPSLVLTSNSSPFYQESESSSSGSFYAQCLLIVHRGIHRISLMSIPGFQKKSHCYYFPSFKQIFLI